MSKLSTLVRDSSIITTRGQNAAVRPDRARQSSPSDRTVPITRALVVRWGFHARLALREEAMSAPMIPRTDVGEQRLERKLGLWLAIAVVINSTIGTGIFKTPAKIARLTGDVPAMMGVWVAGAVIAVCGALTLSELAAAMPRSGGLYEYLRRAWGPRVAFVFGWTKLTLLIPSAVGSFARLAGEALASLMGLKPGSPAETALAVGVLLVCVGVNVLGIRQSVTQQAILTALKYVGVLALAVLGVGAAFGHAATATPMPLTTGGGPSLIGVFGALVSVMWAYDGWADLTSVAGEVKQPERTMPRALLAGTLAIAGVYLLTNVGYVLVLGLGEVSERAQVPIRAVRVGGGRGALYVCFRSFEQLTDGFVCGYFPFYILAVLAVFRLRSLEPKLPRPYRVPGFPVVPLIFVVGAGCLLYGAIGDADRTALFAAAVVAVGIPLSFIWLRVYGR